jgi:hypothetical protein
MTDTDPKPERHIVEQNNHGSGAFVGGDNHGEIRIEAVDPKTKALLGKMSKQAPDLARLLRRSLQAGVISEDTASSLAIAARSINEDVANTLREASQRINEDVAGLLTHASHSINEDVASQMSDAAHRLSDASRKLNFDELDRIVTRLDGSLRDRGHDDLSSLVTRLESSLDSLSGLTRQVDGLRSNDSSFTQVEQLGTRLSKVADRIEARVTPPPPRILPDHRGRMQAFFWGLGIGLALMFWIVSSR